MWRINYPARTAIELIQPILLPGNVPQLAVIDRIDRELQFASGNRRQRHQWYGQVHVAVGQTDVLDVRHGVRSSWHEPAIGSSCGYLGCQRRWQKQEQHNAKQKYSQEGEGSGLWHEVVSVITAIEPKRSSGEIPGQFRCRVSRRCAMEIFLRTGRSTERC